MSRIARIETSLHRLPLDPPFPAAWDRRPRRAFPITVVRVFDDTGAMGIGAGDALRGLVDYLDLFVGQDPLDFERLSGLLENVAFFDGRPWPLDMALWDLAGKLTGTPLWEMMGGTSNRVQAYASSGTHWARSEVDQRVDRVLSAGFGALKLRFGRPDQEEDFAVIEAVRARAGDRLALMVDCNQGWRMPWDTERSWSFDRALLVARRLEQIGVVWMEEPLHRGDYEGMARLRSETSVAIAGGEMTREWHEFRTLLSRGCLDVYQPDTAVTCGMWRLRELAHLVDEADLVFSPHTWGSGLALVANAHLAAGTVGTPHLEYPFDPPEWTAQRRDFLLTEPFEPGPDGWLTLPDGPGLGVELDEEALRATADRSFSYSA